MRIDSPISKNAVISGSFSGSFAGNGEALTGTVTPGTLSGSIQIASEISGSFGAASGSFSTRITATEVELGNTLVSGSSQIDVTATTNYSTVSEHIINVTNPHNVTKTQLGLGSIDNTSDANKPISTAQQAALNLKAPLADPNIYRNSNCTNSTYIWWFYKSSIYCLCNR